MVMSQIATHDLQFGQVDYKLAKMHPTLGTMVLLYKMFDNTIISTQQTKDH